MNTTNYYYHYHYHDILFTARIFPPDLVSSKLSKWRSPIPSKYVMTQYPAENNINNYNKLFFSYFTAQSRPKSHAKTGIGLYPLSRSMKFPDMNGLPFLPWSSCLFWSTLASVIHLLLVVSSSLSPVFCLLLLPSMAFSQSHTLPVVPKPPYLYWSFPLFSFISMVTRLMFDCKNKRRGRRECGEV